MAGNVKLPQRTDSHDLQHQADYSASTMDAKVVILGRQGVGKTSLVRRYTSNTYHPPSTQSTTGAFFVTKKCTLDGIGVRLQIWDTAGQERFRSMAPMYIRGANAAIVVYDLTNEASFQEVRTWIDELKKSMPPELLVYVVGSKSDLASVHRAISTDHARRLLNRWYPPPPRPSDTSLSPTPMQQSHSALPHHRRHRLISLPAPLPTSRSTPALSSSAEARPRLLSSPPTPHTRDRESGRAHSRSRPTVTRHMTSPPTPATIDVPGRRPRFVSSPSTPIPTSEFRSRYGHGNGYGPAHGNGNGNGNGHAKGKVARPWSWGSGPEEKDEYADDDETSPSEEDDDDDDDEEEERGNWELFEVSAKDDIGINTLFNHLIRALLVRRHAIAEERELRKRHSVYLTDRSSVGGGGMKVGAGQSGWMGSCCSV